MANLKPLVLDANYRVQQFDGASDTLAVAGPITADSVVASGVTLTGVPEGTAVLSTGEAGGVKYLREDGDGTCSWQTPAGSGDMVLADIQTVTGAKTFNSSKLIFAGSTSGTTEVNSGAVAGTSVLTLPVATDTLVGKATVDVFTNKSIDQDGTGNSITNIADASIKAAAAIDATKIADGTVTSTEFQYINTLTSNAQTQLDAKAASAGGTLTGTWDFGGATDVELPNGAGGHAALTTAGEVTIDTTSKTLNYHDGAAEVALQPVRTAAITIKDPDTTVDFVVFRTNYAITISEIEVVLRGTTPSVTWSLMHNTNRSSAGNTIDSNTTTNTTTGDTHTVMTDATVPADSFIWLEISAESGTTDEMHLSFDFTQDA